VSALDELIREAQQDRKDARTWGNNNYTWHHVLGIIGVLAGVVATVSAATDWVLIVTAVAAALAAIVAALQTFWSAEEKARFHYAKHAEFGAVVLTANKLKERSRGPSDAEYQSLVDQLTAIRARPFTRGGSKPGD
jgi:hypothetical protein